MTRDEYIQQRIQAVKDYITAQATQRGKLSDWNDSFGSDKLFDPIFWGMLADSFGQIWDLQQLNNRQDQIAEEHRLKINEIIRNYNLLVPLFGSNYGLQEIWELPS